MSKSLTPEERRRLAEKVRCNPATLYQAMTGKGAGFSPAECVRIERDSEQELRRWDLRPNDWRAIWPELIDAEGAPGSLVAQQQQQRPQQDDTRSIDNTSK